MASFIEYDSGYQWHVYMPLYRQVLASPYLVGGLKELVSLLRGWPDKEDLFINAARVVGRIINRGMKVVRIDDVYVGDKHILNAWLAPL